MSVLLSTVLYRAAGRPIIRWYARVFRLPTELHRFLSNDRLVRVWGLGSAGVNIAVWWYLGTPDGAAMLPGFGQP